MILSDSEILAARSRGELFIEPFNPSNLGTDTYDVTLGEFYFRETNSNEHSGPSMFGKYPIYNTLDENHVDWVWGSVRRAHRVREILSTVDTSTFRGLNGFDLDDRVVWLYPGETILAHTIEFIGGVTNHTTKMYARSSIGRSMMGVCKCAGRGDVGYFNRWTMEITSFSRYHLIPLKVGMRVAQIEFQRVENHSKVYSDKGKYQSTTDFQQLVNTWTPDLMLPRLHKDRELRTG